MLDTFLLHEAELSNHQVSVELDVDWVVPLNLLLQALNQLSEHFLEDAKLDDAVHQQNLHGNGLVNWQHLLNGWAVVSDQHSGSLLVLALLEMSLTVLHEVSVQHVLTLLFRQFEALVPVASLREHLQATHVSSLYELTVVASGDKLSLLALLDLVEPHLLDLHRSQLLSAVIGSVPLLALHVGLDGLVEEATVLVYLGSSLELLDVEHSWS